MRARHSVNEGFGKEFYRKRQFSEEVSGIQ